MLDTSYKTLKVTEETKIAYSYCPLPVAAFGPTLVFLHFWGGSSKTFSDVISQLSHEYATLAIDFRGWGQSTGPQDESCYSIETLASDVETVVRDLSLDKIIVVGHSMGGKVAQAIAGRGKISGLRGLVLIAPAPPTALVLPLEMRHQQVHAYDSRENAEAVIRTVLTGTMIPDTTLQSLVDDMTRGSRAARAAWPKYGMAEDVSSLVSKIDKPVLVIGGESDLVETVSRLRSGVCDLLPSAKMVVVPSSGHLLPVEASQQVSKAISEFISAAENRPV